jgi:sporulation protein YlmC with PRC-barrel domain
MASNKPTTRLRELHGSGYEIKKGQPDITGWDVRDDSRRKFGKVQDLIFDIRAGKVRYMVVNILDTKELDLEKRTVLVPIGLAVLDASDDDVILSSVTPFHLRALPRYDKSVLGAKAERDVSFVFGRSLNSMGSGTNTTSEDVDNSFYEHDLFNEDNMEKNRRSTGANPLHSGMNTSGNQSSGFDKRTDQNTFLRNDDKLQVPHSSNSTDNTRVRDNRTNLNETDEEYLRRTRRNRNS